MEFIIGIKLAPGDHESNFKKVGSVPCGFNTMGTVWFYELFYVVLKNVYILKIVNKWLHRERKRERERLSRETQNGDTNYYTERLPSIF